MALELENIAASLCTLAQKASDLVLEIYNGINFETSLKADNSPLTLADKVADETICSGLKNDFPHIEIVSEERVENHLTDHSTGEFFLIDPIDGTREFVNRNGDFTLNIALIRDAQPVLGVIFIPVTQTAYFGSTEFGCYRRIKNSAPQKIQIRPPHTPPVALASRSHLTDQTRLFLNARGIETYKRAGSSLKFCLLAAGEADIYPRFGPTMEWDTAAGDAILRAAGGKIVDTDGQPLRYGKSGFRNPNFIALGGLDKIPQPAASPS